MNTIINPKCNRFLLATLLALSLLSAPVALLGQQKPTVAVVEFEVRARGIDRSVGYGMGEILTDALLETSRYIVLDRTSTNEILEEQKRALWGPVDPATAAEVGKMLGAQYLVIGKLTKFSEKKKTSRLGRLINKGKPKGGILGTLLEKADPKVVTFESEVSFSLKIVDATTGVLMASKSIDKKDKAVGIAVAGGSAIGGFVYKSKSMENALQDAIGEAVEQVSSQLPAEVFTARHDPDNEIDCANLTGMSAPKIMVVIPEIHIRRRIPDPAGETEIIRRFLEAGFNLVDQKQVAAIRNQERVLNAVKDPNLAASLGVEFGADIIIIGEAFSEFAGRYKGMIACRARVEARAIATRTGKILAADGRHATGLDISESVAAKTALRNAGGQIVQYFMQQLCKKIGDAAPEVTATEIFFGSTNFKQMLAFQKMLKTVPGIKVINKQLTGSVGRIFVEYKGSTEALAEAIIEAQPENLPFEITGFGDGKLDVKMKEEILAGSGN